MGVGVQGRGGGCDDGPALVQTNPKHHCESLEGQTPIIIGHTYELPKMPHLKAQIYT